MKGKIPVSNKSEHASSHLSKIAQVSDADVIACTIVGRAIIGGVSLSILLAKLFAAWFKTDERDEGKRERADIEKYLLEDTRFHDLMKSEQSSAKWSLKWRWVSPSKGNCSQQEGVSSLKKSSNDHSEERGLVIQRRVEFDKGKDEPKDMEHDFLENEGLHDLDQVPQNGSRSQRWYHRSIKRSLLTAGRAELGLSQELPRTTVLRNAARELVVT